MSEAPFITVLIPARNEEADIERCLRAVLSQDHPHDRMEIVLVDGGSNDATASVARQVLGEGDIGWKLVDNPVGTTPSNLNTGLAVASGEILCRVDARSLVPPEYVRICSEVLCSRPEVAVVGGAQVAIASSGSIRSSGIARGLNNRFAMGGARYRSGARSGTADTVYLGAFRTVDLRRAGGWDERMLTNQDFELNRRMGNLGLVCFDHRLAVGYVPRQRYSDLWRQYLRFGRWKARYWAICGERPRPRQVVLLALPPVSAAALTYSWRRARFPTVFLASSGLAAVDHFGVAEPAALRLRVAGLAASIVASVGWWTGVVVEWLGRP